MLQANSYFYGNAMVEYYKNHFIISEDDDLEAYSRESGVRTAYKDTDYDNVDFIIHNDTKKLIICSTSGNLEFYDLSFGWFEIYDNY